MDRWDGLRVDGGRLWNRLVELGEVGAIKDRTASRAAAGWPSPTPIVTGAISSSAGCVTSASQS